MNFLDLITQIDKNIQYFVTEYEGWVYLILFIIIFIKTGVGFLSFVPGETLLVAVGTMSFQKYLEPHFCLILLGFASVLGGVLNFVTGQYVGEKLLGIKIKNKYLIKQQHIEKLQKIYQKYGAKILVLVRFVPVFRSVAPFTAGMSNMKFLRFFLYNVIGGYLWVMVYLCIGYFFGNIFL